MAARSAPSRVLDRLSAEDSETPRGSDPPDAHRVRLALEALSGAKWLLLLAYQALDGSLALQPELEETKRGHQTITGLCELLSRHNPKQGRNSQ